MSDLVAAVVTRHVHHDIRECDCPPAVVLLTLGLYEAAAVLPDLLTKMAAALDLINDEETP